MEIKIDIKTLPKNQMHIQFQTFESEEYDIWLKGFYSDEQVFGRDNNIYSIRKDVTRWISIDDAPERRLEIGA